MMEDDCDISVVKHGVDTPGKISSVLLLLWDILQIAIINPAMPVMQMHYGFINDFSTAAYVINRGFAEDSFSLYQER